MPKCPDCRTKEAELTTWWERLKNRVFRLFSEEIIDLSQDRYTQGFGDGYKMGGDHASEHFNKTLASLESPKGDMPSDWFVDPAEVISVVSGRLFRGSDELAPAEIKSLKAEVKLIANTRIWQLATTTLRQKAIEKAVLHSTDLQSTKGNEQVLAGKMMIHNLGILKSVFDVVEKH